MFSFTNSSTKRAKGGYNPSNRPKPKPKPLSQYGVTVEDSVATGNYLEAPEFAPVAFETIKPAAYDYTDPLAYAKQVAAQNQGMIQQNWAQGKGLALDALETELQGLKGFTAGSAALKREQIAVDNAFNQQQRTAQLRQVMPEAAGDLAAQRSRAAAYAEGRLPDSMLDRAMELGIRSNAADTATYAGFGAKSAQASKLSDLMSAEQRFQLGQYGENLIGQNMQTKANLMLAPTQYSTAGSEIKVMPEVGAARLAYQGMSAINEATMLTPSAALTAKIGQNQFTTQLAQRTNEFNATGKFNAATFNTTGAYTAALNKFNYDIAYQDSLVAANQSRLDMATALQTAGIMQGGANQGLTDAQQANLTTSLLESMGISSNALNALGDTFKPSAESGTTQERTKLSTEPLTTSTIPTATTNSSGFDASIPTGVKYANGVETPAGYAKVASNSDGTYSAVPIADYSSTLQRFAEANQLPLSDVKIENAALADRAIANATGSSYIPLPSFQPIGTLSNGRQVYSMPAAAAGANIGSGAQNVANIGNFLGALGASNPEVNATLQSLGTTIGNPNTIATLDENYRTRGKAALSTTIANMIYGGTPDAKTDHGQQGQFMVERLADMWGGLSPEQKANGLAAMTGTAIANKTGIDINNEIVPGTDRSAAGALRIGDAVALTTSGVNGMALARNWNQLSTLVNMANKPLTGINLTPANIARVTESIGALGYGPQGAAVPVEPKYFEKVGARAAPELGVGAVVFDKPAHVPPHYKMVTQAPDGGVVAMPGNMLKTSTLGAGGPGTLAYNKSKDIATGKHPAMKLWGKSKTNGVRGSAGGSALIYSMDRMVNNNPELAGAMIAHSLFNNVMGSDD